MDYEKLVYDYKKAKENGSANLLPFDKVLALETEKQELIISHLSKIQKIDDDFEIITETGFKIHDLIKIVKSKFGDLNFSDTSSEGGKLTIDMAFHFCIITMSYFQGKMKYRINVFWDA